MLSYSVRLGGACTDRWRDFRLFCSCVLLHVAFFTSLCACALGVSKHGVPLAVLVRALILEQQSKLRVRPGPVHRPPAQDSACYVYVAHAFLSFFLTVTRCSRSIPARSCVWPACCVCDVAERLSVELAVCCLC
jgi:hypothetical protein